MPNPEELKPGDLVEIEGTVYKVTSVDSEKEFQFKDVTGTPGPVQKGELKLYSETKRRPLIMSFDQYNEKTDNSGSQETNPVPKRNDDTSSTGDPKDYENKKKTQEESQVLNGNTGDKKAIDPKEDIKKDNTQATNQASEEAETPTENTPETSAENKTTTSGVRTGDRDSAIKLYKKLHPELSHADAVRAVDKAYDGSYDDLVTEYKAQMPSESNEEKHDNTTPTIPRVTHQQWEDKVIELMKSGKYNSTEEVEAAASKALGINSEADTISDEEVAREEANAKARDDAARAAAEAAAAEQNEQAENRRQSERNAQLAIAGLKDYSSVDFDSIDEVTADWDRIISSFQGYIEGKAAECEGFKLAQDAEVENGIIKSLDDRVTNIISMLQASSSTIKSVAQLLLQTDEDVGKDAPEQEGGDDDSGTPEPTPTPTNPSGGSQGKDNAEEQIKLLEGLNMSDLSELTDELIKYCQENNIELDKLINDENYASQLKLALLDSEVLSQDMKTKIMEGLESATQKALQTVIRGSSTEQIGLNEDTKLVMQETLTRIANANQTSLENLLKDDQYASIVKEAIGSISKNYTDLGTKEDPTKNLESIIKTELVKQDGTDSSNVIDLNADTNNTVAKYIKIFASSKNITNVDELLNNSELKSSLKTLGTLSAFSDNISKFGDSTTQSILYDLLVGGNN